MRNECIVDGVGESCLARADCKAGLHCIKNTCVTQGAPPGPPVAPQGAPPWPAPPSPAPPLAAPPGVGAPQPPGPPAANLPHPPVAEAEPATPATYADWRIGRGTRALVGSNVLPGFGISYAYSSSTATAFFPALLFGLRGGVLFGRTELAAELSPGTWLPSTNGGGVVQANASIGYLAHLAGDFYWPLRFGLGVAGPSLPTALFMQRLDLFGVAYNWSHLLFEAHLPSFRHGTDLSSFSVFDWHFGVEASYVF